MAKRLEPSYKQGAKAMIVLVINMGSSSLKAGLFDTSDGKELFRMHIEDTEHLTHGLDTLAQAIHAQGYKEPDAIGHRVVHGGPHLTDSTLVDDEVLRLLQASTPLAPLHNPLNLRGLYATLERWPHLPQVTVFDTAFHKTLPPYAATYAIPASWRALGIRRYGFHGISHQYIAERIQAALPAPRPLRVINCHLGNGASLCAIQEGRSIDTSMGFTALPGLIMGTRCGDIDPGIFGFLHREQHLSIEEIESALYHQSGMKELSGISHDMRQIEAAAQQGDQRAQLALESYSYRVRHYIGGYAANMGGVDVLVFTAGVGEGSASIREAICQSLGYLGVQLDPTRNASTKIQQDEIAFIQSPASTVKIAVVHTREEWMIAKETARLLDNPQRSVP